MVKINSISDTATFAWSNDSIPILATGTAAGVIDDDFSSNSSLSFYNLYEEKPILKIDSEAKFHDLDWSRSNNLLAGALENGTIQFWDTSKLSSNRTVTAVATNKKHTSLVKSLQFSKVQSNVLASGGANGEIFIYDTNKIANLEPFAPGTAMTPMDTVNSVAWNNSVSHIFASAGTSGYTSIWDLRAKKEVLHLSYTASNGSRAVLSTVAWHPTQSTRLVTASDADGAPVILTWDLRNSNAPLKTLEGHKKGVLSLDWNSTDSALLLSSGKDNTTILWNPETAEMLAQYPTTANWIFKSRFAPTTPDIFATASFDKKVVIQTLQDTSPPVSNRTQSTSETDFWSNISEVDTQQPEYFVQQAPNWYGRKSSVAFGFGGKLVTVSKTGDKSSEIKVTKARLPGSQENTALNAALDTHDFKSIVETRLSESFENINKSDWELLKTLDGTSDVFEKFIALTVDDSPEIQKAEDEDFFNNLKEGPAEYVPSGEFKFEKGSEELVNSLLTKNLSKAVDILLKENRVVEALIIAQNGPEPLKKKVTDFYFAKTAAKNPVSRLLYSISKDSVTDLVENGEVKEWKRIGNAIKTYAKDQDVYKTQFAKLGDRILRSSLTDNRNEAILNYINASALDKVADIWVSELKELETKILQTKKTSIYDAHFDSLTEFVEKFSAYRTTLKLDAPMDEASPLLSTILEYISIISTSGQFELAKKFLSLLPDSPAVKLEKTRIEKALGVSAVQTTGSTGASRYAAANNINRARPGVATNPYLNNTIPTATPTYGQPPLPQPAVTSGFPSPVPVANPYAPQHSAAPVNPYKVQEAPQQPIAPLIPSAPPKGKVTTDGWNDLPTNFHKAPTRRATPAAPVTFTPQANGAANGPPPPAIARQTSFNAPQLPPPPTNISRAPSSQVSSPPPPPPQPSISAVNSRYAPTQSPVINNAVPTINSQAPPNPYAPTQQPPQPQQASSTFQSQHTPPVNPYAPSPNVQHAAPVNPYAPAPGAQQAPPQTSYGPPLNSYGSNSSVPTPPANTYAPAAAPTQQSLPVNPYAPAQPQHQQNQYGIPHTPVNGGNGSFGAPPIPGPPIPASSLQTQPPVPAPPAPIVPAEPPKPKHPAGDRSHIPNSELKIFQVLSSQFEGAKPSIPEKFSKQIIDTEKRLNILFDHLNNEDLLTPAAIADLHQVVDALEKKDFASALDLQVALMSNHTHESANWGTGVKRLIQFVEATV